MTEEPYKLYEVLVVGIVGDIRRPLENQLTYGRNFDEAKANFRESQEELIRLWKKSHPSLDDVEFLYSEAQVQGAKITVEPLEQKAKSPQ